MTVDRVAVRDLRKAFDGNRVLDGIDLSVEASETVALMGRSGSGKSTLLRCIALLETPDSGDLILDDQIYASGSQLFFEPWEVRRNIVLVFQDFALFENMTILENITFALVKSRGITRRVANEHAEAMAVILGIERLLGRYPSSLSGGETQRGALARAMVLKPKVLLLDEITSALDPETVLDVTEALRAIKTLNGIDGTAIIAVTHLLDFAESFADQVAFIHAGKIHEKLPAKAFVRSCKKPETQKFVERYVGRLES